MGIRYFAFAVSARQIAQSRECPRDCVPGNLVRAREFAQRVADAGFGIRYQIG